VKETKTKFKPHLAAAVLIEAAYKSDSQACEKYGVSLRSLQNWRRRLHEDEAFAAIFATEARNLEKEWASEFLAPIRRAAILIDQCYQELLKDPTSMKSAAVIQAIADSARTCADILLTQQAINAQFGDPNKPENQLPQEVPSTLAVEYPC
jgi:hypothetical protein